MKLPLLERFWSKVDKSGECWRWIASTRNGYGIFAFRPRQNVKAHRFSWELVNGSIPEGKLICHLCDVKTCVNPEHLYVGDCSQNMLDAFDRGQYKITEKHHMAKGANGKFCKVELARKQ